MNKSSIEKLLKSANQKPEINRQHKESLRRDLLNSGQFNRKKSFFIFGFREVVAATTLVIFAAIVILVNSVTVTDNPLTDILKNLKTNYAGFVTPGMVSNFDSQVQLNGYDDIDVDFQMRQVVDFTSKKYRATIKDPITGELLYDALFTPDGKYVMSNPKISFVNTEMSSGQRMIFAQKIDAKIDLDSSHLKLHSSKISFTSDEFEKGYIVVKREILNQSEINLGYKPETVYNVHRHVNFDEYLTTTPYDLYKRLMGSDSLEYAGEIKLSDDSETYKVVSLVDRLSQSEFKGILVRLNKDSVKTTEILTKIAMGDSNYVNWILESSDTQNFTRNNFVFDLPSKLITVFISPESEIVKCKYSIRRNNNSVDIAGLTFSGISKENRDESVFDPVTANLKRADL